MNTCIGITKKGDKCKNTIRVGNVCHLHKGLAVVKASTAPVKVVKNLIYDPYYGKNVSHKNNCGIHRESLKRIPDTNLNKNFVSMFCDVLPLKNIINVVGPVSYVEFKYKTYNIGIFGETHNIKSPPKLPKKNTLNFASFISSIVSQNDGKEYDFFVETFFRHPDYVHLDTYSGNTILNLLEIDFKGCFDIVKKCPYKNLRAHYTDYRSISNMTTSDLYPIYRYILSLESLNDNRAFPPELQLLIKNPLVKFDKLLAYVDNIIYTDKKLIKQLNSIPVEIKNSILKCYELIMKTRVRKEFEDFINNSGVRHISFLHPTKNDEIILTRFIAFYLMVYGSLMDVYTLARMFKVYDPHHPKNIIVYAGSSHTRVYTLFMLYFLIDRKPVISKYNFGANYIIFTEDDKQKSFLFT